MSRARWLTRSDGGLGAAVGLTVTALLAALARPATTARLVAAAGLVAAAVAATLLVASCGSSEQSGQLELWVRADSDDLGGMRSLMLDPDWAGANVGPVRDASWLRIPISETPIELPAAGGGSVLAARGAIPSGSYDRVFVSSPSVVGTAPDGSQVLLISHVEPIARGFDLRPGSSVAVEIELVVLPGSSESDGRREVFVKDARLVEPPAAGSDHD